MTPEERAEEIDATRKSMIMIPLEDLKAMQADHKRQEERDKQRADAKGSIADPLEVDDDDYEEDNDNDNDKREDELFSNDSNADPDKGGYRASYDNEPYDNDPDDNDPDDNDPGGDDDPDEDYSQSTDDEQTKGVSGSVPDNPTCNRT